MAQYGGFSPLTAANMQMLQTLLPPQQAPQSFVGGGGVSASPNTAPSGKIGANYHPAQNASQTTPNNDWFSQIINQPITKGILNALSTPAYIVGNAIDTTAKDIQSGNLGDIPLGATVGAIGKGLSAGLGQNPNDAVMPSKALEDIGRMQDPNYDQNTPPAAKFTEGLIADMGLDPLSYVGGGPTADILKGAVRGATQARLAGQMAKAGSDVAEETNILKGAFQGGKQGFADYKQGLQDAKQARSAKDAAKNIGANTDYTEENVAGLKFLPDKTPADMTANDMATAGANESKARNMAASPVGTDNAANVFAPTPPENSAMMASLIEDKDMVPPELKAADAAVSKETPLPENRTIANAVQTEKAGKQAGPDLYAASNVKTDLPPLVKASDYSHYSPADRFVAGTEHLVGTEPKYSELQSKNLNDYFGRPQEETKSIDWQGVINDLKQAPVGQVLKNKTSKVGRYDKGSIGVRQLGDMIEADYLDNPKKFTGEAFMKWLPNKFLDKHAIKTDNVELPTVERASELGLDPTDFSQAISDGHVNNITKPTGNLNRILDQMGRGELPVEDVDRFHNFMRSFAEAPDMTLEDAIQSAKDYVKNNKDAVLQSSKTLRATSDGGRLGFLKGAGDSPQVALSRVVDAGTAEPYRVPFTPEKTAQILDAQAKLADDSIKMLGPHADFVGQLADNALKSTIKLQDGLKNPITGGVTWTTNAAIHPYTTISKGITEYLLNNGIRGRSFSHMKDAMVMAGLGKVDAEMKRMGVFPYLTNVMPKDGVAIRATMYDVLASLSEKDRIHFLGYGRPMNAAHMLPTQIMDGAETMLRTVIDDGGELTRAKVQPQVIENMLGKFSEKDIEKEIALNLDQSVRDWNSKLASKAVDAAKFEKNRTAEMRSLYRSLETALPQLTERVLHNNALHGEIMGRRLEAISEDTLNRLNEVFDKGSVGEAVDAIANTKPIKSELEPEAAELSNESTQQIKNEFATPIEQTHADQAVKTSDEWNKYWEGADKNPNKKPSIAARKAEEAAQQSVNKSNVESLKRTQNPVINTMDSLEGDTDSLINLHRENAAAQVAMKRHPFQRIFNATFGKWGTYDQMRSGVHGLTASHGTFLEALNDLSRRYSADDLKLGMENLKAGEGKMATPATWELSRIMDTLFDDSARNIFSRNGVARDHFNEILDGYRLPDEWRLESKDPQKMAQEWKSWTIDDPLRFMAAMDAASNKAMLDIHMGATFSTFGQKTLSAEEWASKNFVKIDPATLNGKDNRFARLIDSSLYYPKEIAQEIPFWNQVLTDSRQFKGVFGDVVAHVVDPMVNALKMTNTVMKPGHHLMSLIGNILTNSLIMGGGAKEYGQNIRIMLSRRQLIKELSGVEDFVRTSKNATEGVTLKAASDGTNSVRFTNIVGKGPINLRNEDLFALMEARGAYFPMNHGGAAEDWLKPEEMDIAPKLGPIGNKIAGMATGASKGITKLLNNRFVKMNEFTSERENLTRGALFLWAMKSKPFKNFGEAADYATSVVRRAYPTAADFTAAESKYVRRMFFYYTWQRGILPVIAEAAITHPAWVMAPSKLMYNVAQANGIDPQSMGDPFPPDSLFPKYYQDMVLGPDWKDDNGHYWGFNITSPVFDTLNTLGAGVSVKNLLMNPFDQKSGEAKLGRTLLGMTNPFIKVPADLISGTDIGTGVPIKDAAEHLQDQVGPARFLSQATGKDLISSTNGILANRTGTQYENGFASPQDWWNNAIHTGVNYGTGLQFKDFNSTSAMKSAQYDLTHNNPNKPANKAQANKQAARGGLWFNQ